jgi:hypothetical protein
MLFARHLGQYLKGEYREVMRVPFSQFSRKHQRATELFWWNLAQGIKWKNFAKKFRLASNFQDLNLTLFLTNLCMDYSVFIRKIKCSLIIFWWKPTYLNTFKNLYTTFNEVKWQTCCYQCYTCFKSVNLDAKQTYHSLFLISGWDLWCMWGTMTYFKIYPNSEWFERWHLVWNPQPPTTGKPPPGPTPPTQ